MTKKEYEEEE